MLENGFLIMLSMGVFTLYLDMDNFEIHDFLCKIFRNLLPFGDRVMATDSYFKHIKQLCGKNLYNFLKDRKGNLILVLRIVARPWQGVSKTYFMS